MTSAAESTAGARTFDVLSTDECWRLLDSVPVGRVAFTRQGVTDVFPVNHGVSNRTIVFRTSIGRKLHAAWEDHHVAFEVDSLDCGRREGWSVVAHGIAAPVTNPVELERLGRLDLHPWVGDDDRNHWVRIRVMDISGRRLAPA